MVAFISAIDPIFFTYPDVIFHRQVGFAVDWDTGDSAVKGRIFRSLNGSTETVLASAPAGNKGTANEKISLDQIITFVLRKATDGQELARTTVTTQKNALAAYMTDPYRDFIFSLKVNPAVDTIDVSFQTKQPAVPYVEIRRKGSGELMHSWMGSGGFRQQHQREFNGFGRGLPQDTVYNVRIVALKDIGGGRVRLGSDAHNPEVRGEVITGTRTVSFLFDLIHVRNDGDPDGAGEFTFTFGVGDVTSQTRLGPVEVWGEGDIADGGDREVAKVFTINHAPRRMWAQVNAWEDDASIFNPETLGFGAPALGPGFDQPGSYGFETDYGSFASVTAHFDTDEAASGRQRGFTMSTGNFSIAYDVYGSMTVTRRNGINNFKGLSLGRVKPKARRAMNHSVLLAAGRTRTIGTKLGYTTVSLGPDGAVIVRTVDHRTGAGSAADLGGCFDTSVTLVESPGDTLHVLGMTSSGEVVARTVTPKSAAEGVWLELGGKFTGHLTGVARDRLVDMLARDTQGQVFHRMLPPGGSDGDWRRIGGGVASPVAATGTPEGDLAVFGLGVDGRILHKRLPAAGEWTPGSEEWNVLCRVDQRTATEGTIAVHWETDKDVIVSAFIRDELAGALLWHRYPEPDPGAVWMSFASADSLDLE